MRSISMPVRGVFLAVFVLCLCAGSCIGPAAFGDAILTNGSASVGVNDDGSLHVLGGPPSITGDTHVGARYIKPGVGQIEYIFAEGWGVADPVTGVTGGSVVAAAATVGATGPAVHVTSAMITAPISWGLGMDWQ